MLCTVPYIRVLLAILVTWLPASQCCAAGGGVAETVAAKSAPSEPPCCAAMDAAAGQTPHCPMMAASRRNRPAPPARHAVDRAACHCPANAVLPGETVAAAHAVHAHFCPFNLPPLLGISPVVMPTLEVRRAEVFSPAGAKSAPTLRALRVLLTV